MVHCKLLFFYSLFSIPLAFPQLGLKLLANQQLSIWLTVFCEKLSYESISVDQLGRLSMCTRLGSYQKEIASWELYSTTHPTKLQISLSAKEIAFVCPVGSRMSREVPIRNASAHPIHISAMVPSDTKDNLTRLEIKPSSIALEPEEQGHFTLFYAPRLLEIQKSQLILVCEDIWSTTFQVPLHLECVNEPPLLCDKPIVHFGTVPMGVEKSARVSVKNRSSLPIDCSASIASASLQLGMSNHEGNEMHFSVDIGRIHLDPGQVGLVNIRYFSNKTGFHQAELVINAGGGVKWKVSNIFFAGWIYS